MWNISSEYLGFLKKKVMINIYVEYFHQVFGISDQKKDEYLCGLFPLNIWVF